jgi:hypothetical protein
MGAFKLTYSGSTTGRINADASSASIVSGLTVGSNNNKEWEWVHFVPYLNCIIM